MSYIRNYIDALNNKNRKAFSIYLTSGFPDKHNFVDLARKVLDAGADMIELGIPFSDPLADGPVIQASSKIALDNGVTTKDVLDYSEQIAKSSDKPIILMGYANPIKKYGLKMFLSDAKNSGVKGLIVPDVPLEEYDSFFTESANGIEIIILTTPTSSDERISAIDEKSQGFVYCVSLVGTTGVKTNFEIGTIENINRTYSLVKKNKMMIGFGISKPENIKSFSPYCDGVIVGSRIMKSLLDGDSLDDTISIIKELSCACGEEKN
jgi:tryptophan synthase alpha chain